VYYTFSELDFKASHKANTSKNLSNQEKFSPFHIYGKSVKVYKKDIETDDGRPRKVYKKNIETDDE